LHLLILWTLAFVTLAMALLLLSVFFALIEDDLTLKSAGKEASIAAIASLIEGASVWAIVTFIPPAGPFLAARFFIPALVVGIIYKATHLEDWGRYEIILLLLFQLVISTIGASLIFGHFASAFGILFAFAVCLAVTIAFMRGL
jgi:hypothetical protein